MGLFPCFKPCGGQHCLGLYQRENGGRTTDQVCATEHGNREDDCTHSEQEKGKKERGSATSLNGFAIPLEEVFAAEVDPNSKASASNSVLISVQPDKELLPPVTYDDPAGWW